MLAFLFVSLVFSDFHRFSSIQVSAKVARVSIAGRKDMLAVSEIPDSIKSFQSHLVVYLVGASSVGTFQTVSGLCYSLGTQLKPFQYGFFATAPAASFSWGKPGALLYRIVPPTFTFESFDDQRLIPYGEVFATSKDGKTQCLCSPFSAPDCLVVRSNQTFKISPPTSLSLFGQGVGCSPNGSTLVVVSKSLNGDEIIQVYSKEGNLLSQFEVQHEPPMQSRSKPPIVTFLDEGFVVIGFPEIGKVIFMSYSNNEWNIKKSSNMNFVSLSNYQKQIITVSKDGLISFIDRVTFYQKRVMIVQKEFDDSAFTDITAGSDWFAVLEESANQRKIHIITSKRSPLVRGVMIFLCFAALSFMTILIRTNVNFKHIYKTFFKRRNTKRI